MIQSTRRHLRLLFISFLLFLTQGRTETLFPEYRTVWLSRDVLVLGRESIRNAFIDLKNAGFNTVFVNNWYKGSTIYPSQVLADYGGTTQLAEFEGWDPLQVAIQEGHQIGLEIHLWFEYGLWLYMTYDDTTYSGPILSQHPGWLMKKRNGSNYNKDAMYGTVQFWADPANDSAMQFIVELVEEAARNYPELDGIEMDRIRYPSTDFSFSDTTRSAYMRETGGSDPLTISTSSAEWATFVQWRERQTSDVANKIYRAVKAINPRLVVSAAVVPPYMLSGSDDKMQDWPTWCRERSIDFVSPMLYRLQDRFDDWLGRCLSEYASPMRIVPGFNIDGLTDAQISTIMNATRNRQMPGGAVWYYGYLNETNLSHFGTEVFANPVPTPRNQIIIDDKSTTYVSGSGVASNTGGWNGTFGTGSGDSYFKWNIPLYVSGMFALSAFLPSEWQSAVDWTYQIVVNGDTTTKSLAADKASGEWTSLGYFQLNYDDAVQVIVSSSNSNGFAADAMKLTRVLPFQIVEGFPTTPTRLSIQFDCAIDTTSIHIAQFAISPSVTIREVIPDSNDLSVLRFVCDSLATGISYHLSAWNLRDSEGNLSDTVSFIFRYQTGFSETIDNQSALFYRQSGTWDSITDSNVVGNSYVKTPCGDGTARVYWRYPAPETGYYQVTALFPDSAEFADDACYIVKNGLAFDTTRVNQQIHYPEGCPLSVTWAEKGISIVVKLHNLSTNSSNHWVVADAVKIERTFYSEVETPAPIAENFTLLPNYPNPFNGQTTLAFILPKPGDVRIEVFDLTGREVRNINLKNQPTGRHNLRFDFGDLNSGVYIYRVISDGKQKVGKMALVK